MSAVCAGKLVCEVLTTSMWLCQYVLYWCVVCSTGVWCKVLVCGVRYWCVVRDTGVWCTVLVCGTGVWYAVLVCGTGVLVCCVGEWSVVYSLWYWCVVSDTSV